MPSKDRRNRSGLADFYQMPEPSLSEADRALYSQFDQLEDALPGAASLVLVSENRVQVGPFVISPVGITQCDNLDANSWEALPVVIRQVQSAVQWIIGDWANLGNREWGTGYEQMAEMTGYTVETLHNFAWVAAQVEISLRNENLTWTHHYHVAGMDQANQQLWLNHALENKWSSKQLFEAIQDMRPTLPSDLDRFSRFLAQSRQKYQRFGKKFRKLPVGEREQISQMLDQEIEYLSALRKQMNENRG